MAGAGYKLFNTGDVLTAQQVNEYLMQQTVMVFADASARTTALSGVLAEGMLSYLKSTDATEVYNGSAWVALAADQTPLTTKGDLFTYTTADARLASSNVNGDVLTVDTSTASGLKWAAPAGAGGYTLIAEQTASSSTGIDFTSISSTYKTLILVWSGIYQDGDRDFEIRLNNDSGSNYAYSTNAVFGDTTPQGFSASRTTIGSGNDYYLFGRRATSTDLHRTVKGFLRIENANSTSKLKHFVAQGLYFDATAAYTVSGFIQGIYNSTSAISQINIVRISAAGTLTNVTNTSIQLWGLS